ncbi:hypothetical protein F5148DRAFT_1202977 [Russula earlei]|uniref:Uncharacterized protein n=1 Tax=Russula earlei TaxID=71964 RepID=A0ACC0U7U1_9AGAM|nr:hypothetical protein F5148DRAFT_1202977 [Russula earlei]
MLPTISLLFPPCSRLARLSFKPTISLLIMRIPFIFAIFGLTVAVAPSLALPSRNLGRPTQDTAGPEYLGPGPMSMSDQGKLLMGQGKEHYRMATNRFTNFWKKYDPRNKNCPSCFVHQVADRIGHNHPPAVMSETRP